MGRIISVDPGIQLTGTIMGAFLSYVLVPPEHDVTRLLLTVVVRTTRPPHDPRSRGGSSGLPRSAPSRR